MNRKDLITFIRLGFEPSHFFKRSVWTKVERIMEYLVNAGLVEKQSAPVKYRSTHTVDELVDAYLKSPFSSHLEEMEALSKELHLPLCSKELLNNFLNLK